MEFLRRFGLSLAVLIFSLTVSLIAVFVSLRFVADTPTPLKSALATSGIYASAAPESLAQQSELSASLPLNNPEIQQILTQSLPPSFIQSSSEKVIDSTYAWAQGSAPTLNFSIDTSEVKNNFANNLAAYVQHKLDALPVCALVTVPPTSIEGMLALTCKPRGVSSAAVAETARQEALKSTLFANGNTIDATTFKDTQGRPLTDQLSFIPTLHSYYIISLFVLPLLAVLSALTILFWSVTKRAGVKRIAWILISTGITSVVLAVVEVWLLHAGVSIFGLPASTTPSMQDKILAIVEILATDLRMWWIGFGAGYTVLGIILLVVLRLNRPKPALQMSGAHSPEPDYTVPTDIYESTTSPKSHLH